ncbi:hypothetical protein PR048_010626 [Dryococelus australis]|uniref:Uncharacterized protein n=1 Tax=Dryococelus australis TaxID=614101 RepID=A0ABQ9I4C1_9NEOP|nr:hypothetical protein PR048_010626 [Dryococelus australis]
MPAPAYFVLELRLQRGWEIPEKTRRPAASAGTIPTCENPGVTRPEIEPGSPWWDASSLTAQPHRPIQPKIMKATTKDCVLRRLRPWSDTDGGNGFKAKETHEGKFVDSDYCYALAASLDPRERAEEDRKLLYDSGGGSGTMKRFDL